VSGAPVREHLSVKKSGFTEGYWIVFHERDKRAVRVVAKFDDHECALRFAIQYARGMSDRGKPNCT